MMLRARRGSWWDANKVGLPPPPIETPEGWLMIYRGIRHTAAGCIYRLGLALFDLERPECRGDVSNIVFSCGITIGDDGDTVYPYYGAAD
jgi:predicted GH43/DUF377 family glycosyl hydrolase